MRGPYFLHCLQDPPALSISRIGKKFGRNHDSAPVTLNIPPPLSKGKWVEKYIILSLDTANGSGPSLPNLYFSNLFPHKQNQSLTLAKAFSDYLLHACLFDWFDPACATLIHFHDV
ncbi:uncharacterized protein DS421_16g537870 [Arachis hypogaea]|nr:uncharacterized protein DS421_16g537870 [Arachis hypogaea]